MPQQLLPHPTTLHSPFLPMRTGNWAMHLGVCAAVCWLVATLPAQAQTSAKRSSTTSSANTETPPAQRKVTKVTYQRSTSEESPASRDRRLTRECKGRPNAGACLGYANRR